VPSLSARPQTLISEPIPCEQFEHETFNPNEEEDRIVLHVDFWNFKELTPTELKAMQRVYSLREAYLQAEGAIEVGNLGPR